MSDTNKQKEEFEKTEQSFAKVTDIHEAMTHAVDATFKPENQEKLVQGSYRVSPIVKEKAEQICASNGTTLSAYVRACTEALVRDYLVTDGRSE